MRKESYLERKCVSYCRKIGGYTAKLNPLYNKGAPDRIFTIKGKTFYVEFKTTKGILSPSQKLNCELIKSAGGDVYIIKDYDEFVRLSEGGC